MTYEAMLREKFQGVDLEVEDFYLLERFQIAYLPDRVPQREFAALLWANASIKSRDLRSASNKNSYSSSLSTNRTS